jgi:putative hydrolase of the HAD superfamily
LTRFSSTSKGRKPARIRGVIFDLDDTLYDERQFVRSGFRAVSDHMAKKYGINEQSFCHLLWGVFLKEGRMNVFDKALKYFDMYKRELVLEMVETYRAHFPNITISKNDLKVLLKIKERFRTGLITNGIREVQENKVEALKIKEFFDVIMYATEYGGKSNSEVFLTALEKLSVRTSESIYIDDNPFEGLCTAKKLGIFTVRILRGDYKTLKISDNQLKPDFEIENLRGLFDIVGLIQRKRVHLSRISARD